MQRKVIGILSLLVCSLLFAMPASAANIPVCGPNADGTNEFTLVGQDQAIFEGSDSPKIIQGNVLVTGPNGLVKLGKNITITGTVTAHKIEFHSSGTADVQGKCVANIITGPGGSGASCGPHGANGEFDAFEAAHPNCVSPAAFSSLCGPTPVVAACANAAAPLTVAEGATLNLPADNPATCFGTTVLEKGSVLNLTAPGPYSFKSIRMKSGSQLNGVGGQATVNVNGQFITEPGVFISHIALNSPSATGDVMAIFNNSILTNVVINAPFGRCHAHTGTALKECSEMCCKTLDIEPITAECIPTPGLFCVGAASITRAGTQIKLQGGAADNLDKVAHAFCSPNCTTTSPPAVEATFTFVAGELTITVPGGATCDDKLILVATRPGGGDVQVCFDAP